MKKKKGRLYYIARDLAIASSLDKLQLPRTKIKMKSKANTKENWQ